MDATERIEVQHQSLVGSTSSQPSKKISNRSIYHTAIDNIPPLQQDNVRVFPGKKVCKIMTKEIQLHEQIGTGGQGDVYNATLFSHQSNEGVSTFGNCAVKKFKGNCLESHFGQWPEELFGAHSMCNYICHYYGYSNDGDSFCLLMDKYDCSLRDNIDKQMEKGTYKGRPYHGPIALSIIIKIAIGMVYLHELNIIHRDLKADNILVMHLSQDDDLPANVLIADFDIAPSILGTGFWRAPEILLPLKENIHLLNTGRITTFVYEASKRALPFTTKSDVYSFGMVCYEILTGGIPFEGRQLSNFDAVLSGERPKLPSNLNSKMVNLLNKCWHHDPDARPTFKEIVVELKGFVEGTEVLMALFNTPNMLLNVGVSDPELAFVELKQLVHVLVDKYKQADFVQEASELVDAIEQFKVQFGMRSYKQHPSLPFYEGFSRMVLLNIIGLKRNLLMASCPQFLPEFIRIWAFTTLIIDDTILHDKFEGAPANGNEIDIDENISEEETAKRIAMYKAFKEVSEKHRQSCGYSNRHEACHELLINKNHVGRDHDEIQPCSICKDLPFYAPKSSESKICTFQLYTR